MNRHGGGVLSARRLPGGSKVEGGSGRSFPPRARGHVTQESFLDHRKGVRGGGAGIAKSRGTGSACAANYTKKRAQVIKRKKKRNEMDGGANMPAWEH